MQRGVVLDIYYMQRVIYRKLAEVPLKSSNYYTYTAFKRLTQVSYIVSQYDEKLGQISAMMLCSTNVSLR